MNVLKSRLLQRELERRNLKRVDSTIGTIDGDLATHWGRQIRSVILNPDHMVKDHRTYFETQNVDAYLSGESLDLFMLQYLFHLKK